MREPIRSLSCIILTIFPLLINCQQQLNANQPTKIKRQPQFRIQVQPSSKTNSAKKFRPNFPNGVRPAGGFYNLAKKNGQGPFLRQKRPNVRLTQGNFKSFAGQRNPLFDQAVTPMRSRQNQQQQIYRRPTQYRYREPQQNNNFNPFARSFASNNNENKPQDQDQEKETIILQPRFNSLTDLLKIPTSELEDRFNELKQHAYKLRETKIEADGDYDQEFQIPEPTTESIFEPELTTIIEPSELETPTEEVIEKYEEITQSLKDDIEEAFKMLQENEALFNDETENEEKQLNQKTLDIFRKMDKVFENVNEIIEDQKEDKLESEMIDNILQQQSSRLGGPNSVDFSDYDVQLGQAVDNFYQNVENWTDPISDPITSEERRNTIPAYRGTFENWNLQGEKSFHRLLTLDEFDIDNGELLGHLRRLKQISRLIAYKRGSFRRVSRLFAYGCWCLPRGGALFDTGKGEPVDNIDDQCYKMSKCEACLQLDFGLTCDPTSKGYRFEGFNGPGVNAGFKCLDPEGTCARAICECDVNLANNVFEYLETDYVRKYSNKEDPVRHSFEENCQLPSKSQRMLSDSSDSSGSQKQETTTMSNRSILGFVKNKRDGCCGNYPNRVPFDSRMGKRQCCGTKTYMVEKLECCNDELVALGQCALF